MSNASIPVEADLLAEMLDGKPALSPDEIAAICFGSEDENGGTTINSAFLTSTGRDETQTGLFSRRYERFEKQITSPPHSANYGCLEHPEQRRLLGEKLSATAEKANFVLCDLDDLERNPLAKDQGPGRRVVIAYVSPKV